MFSIAILAGGLATRLRPLTEHTPKVLIEVCGEPFILHQLKLLRSQGITEIVICAGYLGEQIVDALGNGQNYGVNIQYSFDGDQFLGTGGAIKKALPLLGENFFVIYGDSYLTCNYKATQNAFEKSKKLGLMTVFKNHNQWDSSNVEMRENEILVYDKVNKTPRMEYIDYGLGIFNQEAFKNVPPNEFYDLALLYQSLLKNNQLCAHEVKERFYEIGNPKGLAEIREYMQTHFLETVS